MCRASAIYEARLGKRREGWCIFLNKSRDFTYYSDRQVKAKIQNGEAINGLMVNEAGEVVMDESFTTGLLAKTGLANFIPIKEDEDSNISNRYYAVVRVIKSKAGTSYELVSNRCGLSIVSEDRLKAMLSLISVGGARLDDKGRVVIHKGVEVETAPEGSQTEGVV